MTLKIERVGEFQTREGEAVTGVLLVGHRDDVKKAAHLWGEDVILSAREYCSMCDCQHCTATRAASA